MRWFKAKKQSEIKMPKPVKEHTTDIKQVFKKTKSPQGYKRKLFVPIRLIPKASLIGIENDNSPVIFSQLADHCSANQLHATNIEWVDESPDSGCVGNASKVSCSDLAAGAAPQTLEEYMVGIHNISHPGCDCHVVVTLSDLTTYTVAPDTESLDLSSDSDFASYAPEGGSGNSYWEQYDRAMNPTDQSQDPLDILINRDNVKPETEYPWEI